MPNPFPGMDPYLEGEMWQEFHDRLANQISMQLMPLLRPKYVALLEKRYALDYSRLGIVGPVEGKTIYPDVHVVRTREVREAAFPMATVAVEPVEVVSPLPERVPELSIEIRDVAQRQLVTVIEILSPANKHGPGIMDYAEKRLALLQTRTHLLEIDLLRGGTRIELIGDLPPAPYYVFLSRTERRPKTQAWPIPLRGRLPAVPVPLLTPDPDVLLDLQAAMAACYDLVGYELLLPYDQPPPPPPLSGEDAEWVETVLREAGFRAALRPGDPPSETAGRD
ncbi:MAG TPA: DUF4058 family protein [Ardenticatenaceae bacterium]|nr:DUF4058 family protein [Ardenticatenaceae bacterium]